MMKMMGWSSMRFILKCTWMRTSVECTLAVVWYSWDYNIRSDKSTGDTLGQHEVNTMIYF